MGDDPPSKLFTVELWHIGHHQKALDKTSKLLASNYDKYVDFGKGMLAMIHPGMLWFFPASETLVMIGLNLI